MHVTRGEIVPEVAGNARLLNAIRRQAVWPCGTGGRYTWGGVRAIAYTRGCLASLPRDMRTPSLSREPICVGKFTSSRPRIPLSLSMLLASDTRLGSISEADASSRPRVGIANARGLLSACTLGPVGGRETVRAILPAGLMVSPRWPGLSEFDPSSSGIPSCTLDLELVLLVEEHQLDALLSPSHSTSRSLVGFSD